MLEIQNCCLVIVDVQGKLAQLMHNREALFGNIRLLVKAAQILGIPIVSCQQCPHALGPTIPEIAELLSDSEPIDKSSFSCCGEDRFKTRLDTLGRKQIMLCGIEAHVCIYQTALDLLRRGCEVHVLADAVSSRTLENKQIAIGRMQSEDVKIGSTEMAIFELLRTAEHPKFRQIAKLVK
ncbi:MAG: hydrolase [Planctomycetota bacterium]|jgi:nicotinamidase-related amidase